MGAPWRRIGFRSVNGHAVLGKRTAATTSGSSGHCHPHRVPAPCPRSWSPARGQHSTAHSSPPTRQAPAADPPVTEPQIAHFEVQTNGQFVFATHIIADRYTAAANEINAAAKHVSELENEGQQLSQAQQEQWGRFVSGKW